MYEVTQLLFVISMMIMLVVTAYKTTRFAKEYKNIMTYIFKCLPYIAVISIWLVSYILLLNC